MQTIVPGVERMVWHGSTPEAVELGWRWFGWIAYLLPLAIRPSVLPFAWLALLGLELDATLFFRGSLGLPIEQTLLFAATFDPGWIAPRFPSTVDTVFYDGHCGLCHRLVRFLLAEDRRGAAFRFAPLDSQRCRELIPAETRATLPDSVIVLTADGRLLMRSSATRHALSRLGGLWRVAAVAAGILPKAGLDALYDAIAGVRHKLFTRPVDACPRLPTHLRRRFEC
jgi:predicted DCC family thiol-disulfide oxidoreductase YuxK